MMNRAQIKGCRNCGRRGYLTNHCGAYNKPVSMRTREEWKVIEGRVGKEKYRPIGEVVDAENCPRYVWGGTVIEKPGGKWR